MRLKVIKMIGVAVCLVCFAAPANVGAQALPEQQVLSGPGGQFYGYLTPVVVVEKKGKLAYSNADILQHDVVHDARADGVYGPSKKRWCKAFRKGKCPVFWSKRAGLGQTVPVLGLGAVKAGQTYTFFCTLHPGMKGTLVVAP
jgi:plastocyanin